MNTEYVTRKRLMKNANTQFGKSYLHVALYLIFMQQTWISRDFFLALQFSLKTFLEILDVIQVQLQKIFSPNMY